MTTPSEPAPRDPEPETEVSESESAEFRPTRSQRTVADWILGLVLPLIALATVFWPLWYRAFLAGPGERDNNYGSSAFLLGALWCFLFAMIDWGRFRRRAAVWLIAPLIVSGICSSMGIENLAMKDRGVVADCPVYSSETHRVSNRGSSSWETTYRLYCDGRKVSVSESVPSDVKPPPVEYEPGVFRFENEPRSLRVEYDPWGLLGARTQNVGAEPWPWIAAGVMLAVIGIGMRMLIRPAHRRGQSP